MRCGMQEEETGKQTDGRTDGQTGRQTDRETDGPTERERGPKGWEVRGPEAATVMVLLLCKLR